MARQVLVLDEVLAMLEVVGTPARYIAAFRTHAAEVLARKPEESATDAVTVASGFGVKSGHGFVELTVNDARSQMDVKKAREIGLMLIEGAEAATSDEVFLTLLGRMGITDVETRGRMLLTLREIRQGTPETSWPT